MKIKIGYKYYDIIFVDNASEKYKEYNPDDEECELIEGFIKLSEKVIYIQNGFSNLEIFEIIIHEVLHALKSNNGIEDNELETGRDAFLLSTVIIENKNVLLNYRNNGNKATTNRKKKQ